MGRSEWDDEPVEWCSRCGSLAVMDAGGVAYCGRCGGAEIEVGDIEEWERLWGGREMGESEDVWRDRFDEVTGREVKPVRDGFGFKD